MKTGRERDSFRIPLSQVNKNNQKHIGIFHFQKADILYIPLKSNRLNVCNNHLLSYSSQRQLRRLVERDITACFNRVENLMHIKLLKMIFFQWKNWRGISKQISNRCMTLNRGNYKLLTCNSSTGDMRNGLRVLCTFLLDWYIKRLRSSFIKFKHRCVEKKQFLRSYFSKWEEKSNLRKKNRMNGIYFLKLMRSFGGKLDRQKILVYFRHWKSSTNLGKYLVTIKLVFTCWKLTASASKMLKRNRLRCGLSTLKQNMKRRQKFRSHAINVIYWRTSTSALKCSWTVWHLFARKRITFRTIFGLVTEKGALRKSWFQWRNCLQKVQLPQVENLASEQCSNLSVPPSSTFKNMSSISIERFPPKLSRRCSSPFCSHASLFCTIDGASPAKYISSPNVSKSMTPQQKARIRMKALKKMDEDYHERENIRLSSSSGSASLWRK